MEHTEQIKLLDELLGNYSKIANPDNNISPAEAQVMLGDTQKAWESYADLFMPDDVSQKFLSLTTDVCIKLVTKNIGNRPENLDIMVNLTRDIAATVRTISDAAYAAGTMYNRETE